MDVKTLAMAVMLTFATSTAWAEGLPGTGDIAGEARAVTASLEHDLYTSFQQEALRNPLTSVVGDRATSILTIDALGRKGQLQTMIKNADGTTTSIGFAIPRSQMVASTVSMTMQHDGAAWTLERRDSARPESSYERPQFSIEKEANGNPYRVQDSLQAELPGGVRITGVPTRYQGKDVLIIRKDFTSDDYRVHILALQDIVRDGRLLGFQVTENGSRLVVNVLNRKTNLIEEHTFALADRDERSLFDYQNPSIEVDSSRVQTLQVLRDRRGYRELPGPEANAFLAQIKTYPAVSARTSVTAASGADSVQLINK